MRKCLLIATALLCAYAGKSQKIYGISVAAGTDRMLISFNPTTNDFDTLVKTFNYYQPTATKDTFRKVLYFMAPNVSATQDAIVTVKLADTSVTQTFVDKGLMAFPQYYQGNLIALSTSGLISYNLSQNQYSVLDPNLKVTGVHSSDIDLTRGRYIFMKRNSSSALPDTIFVYTIGTRSLIKYPVQSNGNSSEMAYSPTSDKILFWGAQVNTGAIGIYSFSLATQLFNPESILATNNGGTLVSSGTFDAVNNRYFVVRTTNNLGTGFNVLEYRLNTSTAIDHLVGPPGLGFCQYFDNQKIPATAIGSVETDVPFRMFPNPASNSLLVNIDLKGRSASIQIMDLLGKIILSKENVGEVNDINISTLAAGKYLLRVGMKDKAYSRIFEKVD